LNCQKYAGAIAGRPDYKAALAAAGAQCQLRLPKEIRIMSRSLNCLSIVFAIGLPLLNAACTTTETQPATTSAAPSPAASPAQQPTAGQSAESKVPRITVEELKKLMDEKKVVVVDVRSVDAYNIGHIKGSINLPLEKIQAGEYKNLPHDKRIITYCSCGAEHSSAVASVLLEKAGFKDGATLLGGTNAWQQSGGEMEKASPKAKS
jgi:rhodanese-related sulfurtransferase